MTYCLPDCLANRDDDRAIDYLGTYYGASGAPYDGSYFDSWPGNAPDRFTADDLAAVSCLSVFVPPMAARQLLVTEADSYNGLLAAVGPDGDLAGENDPITNDWPASQLYLALRDLHGVGRTIATKLLARKRPKLMPIYDSVVAKVTCVGNYHWEPVRQALRAPVPNGESSLHDHLLALGQTAGVPGGISALRVYDVITWMEGKSKGVSPATRDEQLGAALAEGESAAD